MTTTNLKIEKKSKFSSMFKKAYNHYLDRASVVNIEVLLNSFDSLIFVKNLPLKVGRGGNHIWVSDMSNNRIMMVEFR